MSTFYVDLNGGNDSNNGTSFALRKKTLSSVSAAPGDTIRVMGRPSTNSGTATWTNGSPLVTLSASMTQLLYADGNWQRVSNKVTCTSPSSSPSPKQGTDSSKIACNGTFTTGKVAHYPTASTLNLSAYQQVSLWIRSSVAQTAGALKIELCSDTGGDTVVNSLTVNVALNANQWTAVTLNNGSALDSSVKSVRLNAVTSLASTDIYIDNIIASKAPTAADCLTLNTLISPDNSTWYHIQSINGSAVYTDAQQATAATGAKGFQLNTVTSGTFYMLQPVQADTGSSNSVYAQTTGANGSAGNPITISGGWDTTAMSTQNGWTTIDRLDWTASGLNLTGTTGYVTVDKFNFVRCSAPLGLVLTASGYGLTNSSCAGTSTFSSFPENGMSLSSVSFVNGTGSQAMINIPYPIATGNADWNIINTNVFGSPVTGIKLGSTIGRPGATIHGCNCSGNDGYGFYLSSGLGGACDNNIAKNNAQPGFYLYAPYNFVPHLIHNIVSHGNGIAQVQLSGDAEIYGLDTNTPGGSSLPQFELLDDSIGTAVIYNWTQYTGTNPVAVVYDLGVNTVLGGSATPGPTRPVKIIAHRENANKLINSIYSSLGTITTKNVVGQTGSAMAWKLSPSSQALESSPLALKIASLVCPANTTSTLSAWAKLSAASGVGARFRIEAGPHGIGTVGTDIITEVSTTGWALYSISCRPTKDAVVDVFFETFGSTSQSAFVSGPIFLG